MAEGKIRVIVKRPDEKYGHVTHMSNTLKAFQKAVDGYIETVRVGSALMICNEEGHIKGLQRNFTMGKFYKETIRGAVVLVGTKGDEFTDCPISFDVWKMMLDKWDN